VKSTRLSNISTTLPRPPTFFLDRTFGADLLATELRSWEWPIEVHRKWFNHRTDDDEWIARVSEKHWRIITSDQDLEFRYHEQIVAAKAAIFILGPLKDKESHRKWIEMLANCKRRVVHDAVFAPCPFIARINRDGHVHQVIELMAHGRRKNITQSTASHFELYLP
jgi:hypothetical protein